MKLFGNSSGKHLLRDDPIFAETHPRPIRQQTDNVPDAQQAAKRADARTSVAVLERPETVIATPAPEAPVRTKSRFLTGYLIYVIIFLLIIAGGLTVLWLRMDAYELSRPYRPMDEYMQAMSASDWRDMLSDAGVEDSYLDTLDFSSVSYGKKLGEYSDTHPVYSIRFGKKNMVTATLKEGPALRFGYHAWTLDSMTLVESGLTVYAPEGALVTIHGQPVGPECISQRDALPIELGVLEANRTDIPGLTKYVLNHNFSADDLVVTDADGSTIELGYQKGNSYYYPPMTSGYVIEAPSLATVSVNGIVLTDDNAQIEREPLEDFEDLGGFIPITPADVRYEIDGLLVRPTVKATLPNGTELSPAEESDDGWVFRLQNDAAFAAEQKDRILTIFDAYIAFLGNRNSDLNGNYKRYLAYLVPDSDAAKRAAKSLDSLYWVKGRDTSLDGVELGDVIRYGDDCYTAWLDFTRRLVDGGEDRNSYLFIFTRYQNEWRVVRVMNKTSFIRNG